MTVQELVDAVAQNPNVAGMDLWVVRNTEKVVGGQFDGSVLVRSKPVQSVTLGFNGLLIFADPKTEKAEAVVADQTRLPGFVVAGRMPDNLRL